MLNLKSNLEFQPWPKIPRDQGNAVTITEKIDGTNACIIIQSNEIVGIQSRKRFIKPGDDNFGFACWVSENSSELINLGDGHHYGEWAGPGIQKNPHDLNERKFFLFNTFRWNSDNPNLPKCCSVVPVLFTGVPDTNTVSKVMNELLEKSTNNQSPEGIIVYSHGPRCYCKYTFANSKGKWNKENN